MPSGPSDAKDSGSHRLGGARADFVASLGRKVQDARELVASLEEDPSSRAARDDLRRKLHALGSGARLLRFDAMARSLAEALTVLERGAKANSLRETDVVFVAQIIDDLPALAWSEAPPAEAPAKRPPVAPAASGPTSVARAGVEAPGGGSAEGGTGRGAAAGPESARATESGSEGGAESEDAPGTLPIATLLVGGEDLADTLTEDAAIRQRAFECERTDDPHVALEIARAYAPDLVLVDADLVGVADLVEALLDDPLTEPVPIVVVGSFRAAEEAARFVALGVAKALTKPVPPELLRRTCDEILDARDGRTMRITLGEPTLEQLGDRLAQELRRALVESVDRPARSMRVPLGEGTEVLGALWGAIARVQEIVTTRTGGAVRFGGDAPEGAIALAPWLHHDVAAADRAGGRGRGAATDVRLAGRRVVVADDDPGVTWFISDLLRTAGCEVHEALDGQQALELAFRVQPELVVSDILMPGLDGFALSRALKRDVALRDTPVILLSWKEDLLQRVRELGASAAAYMRKETDSRAILSRVREVLRPRARIEMRLRGDGEVRGRLDGLTARLLLELVGSIRRDARVAVRDASYLYEIEVRDGAPRKATRTASDGGYVSGERGLASLLGVGSGRFVVSASHEPVRGELSGTLAEQMARPLAAARGALAATTGAATMQVERIRIDEVALEEYLRATPEPANGILRRVARGESPRQMLLAGEVPPSLFEDVIADLAARGAVRAVQGAGGVDLLGPAVESATRVLLGAPRAAGGLPPNARPSVKVPAMPARRLRPAAPTEPPASPAPLASLEPAESPEPPTFEALVSLAPPPPRAPAPTSSSPALEDGEGIPSSLEDAVMRELSDRSPAPGGAHLPSNPPPIVEPSELRRRSSNPPAAPPAQATSEERVPLPSLPPDAIVPGASSSEEIPASEPHGLLDEVMADDEVRSEPPEAAGSADTDVEGRYEALLAASTQPLTMPGTAPASRSVPPPASVPAIETTQPMRIAPRTEPPSGVPEATTEAASALEPGTAPAETAAPEVYPEPLAPAPTAETDDGPAPDEPPGASPAGRSGGGGFWLLALLGAGLVIAFALGRGPDRVPEPGPPPTPLPSLPSTTTPPSTPDAGTLPGPSGSAAPTAAPTAAPEPGPSPEIPPGMGLIYAPAPAGARVRIDGAIAGVGAQFLVAGPGFHDVRVERDGGDSRSVVEVRAGETTRVDPAANP